MLIGSLALRSLGQSLPLAVLITLFERETQKLWRRREEEKQSRIIYGLKSEGK